MKIEVKNLKNFNFQVKEEELLTSTELEYFASSLVVGQVAHLILGDMYRKGWDFDKTGGTSPPLEGWNTSLPKEFTKIAKCFLRSCWLAQNFKFLGAPPWMTLLFMIFSSKAVKI